MGTLPRMRLYAAGSNAFNELTFTSEQNEQQGEVEDLYTFRPILEGASIERPKCLLTCTLVRVDGHVLCTNVHNLGFAETNDSDHKLEEYYKLTDNSIGQVLGLRESTDGSSHHDLIMYPSQKAWETQTGCTVWPREKRVKQIAASHTAWVILYEDGIVETMGDTRFEDCLGREVDDSSPASAPHVVSDLASLDDPFRRVAASGYSMAAVTDSGSLYVWGMDSPESSAEPQAVPELTSIPNYIEVGDGKDVAEVAFGEAHALALTMDGLLFVRGSNRNGQLGLGDHFQGRAEQWTIVELDLTNDFEPVAIAAGPNSSLVLVRRRES